MIRYALAPRSLALAVLLSASVAEAEDPPRHACVLEQPVFARLEEGPTAFLLRGHLPRKRQKRLAEVARSVRDDVVRRFVREGPPRKRAVDVCLFPDIRSYRAFVTCVFGSHSGHSDWGFYVPSQRLVVANLGHSVGNLRHEMVHPMVGDDFPTIPAWLNEGLGSLYGTARRRAHGYRFLVNYRLRHLKQARAQGTLPDLEALAESNASDVYGRQAPAYYAAARYVLLYLDRRGRLTDLYRALRDDGASPAEQSRVLEKLMTDAAFIEWTNTLQWPRS